MLKLAVLVVFSTALGGCATILDRSTEAIAIDTDPSAAALRMTCPGRSPQEAITPAVLRVERRAGHCLVEVSKPGYGPQTMTLEKGMNLRILGNLLPAALGFISVLTVEDNLSGGADLVGGTVLTGVGFLVDAITRRSADHDPKQVTIRLEPLPAPTP